MFFIRMGTVPINTIARTSSLFYLQMGARDRPWQTTKSRYYEDEKRTWIPAWTSVVRLWHRFSCRVFQPAMFTIAWHPAQWPFQRILPGSTVIRIEETDGIVCHGATCDVGLCVPRSATTPTEWNPMGEDCKSIKMEFIALKLRRYKQNEL